MSCLFFVIRRWGTKHSNPVLKKWEWQFVFHIGDAGVSSWLDELIQSCFLSQPRMNHSIAMLCYAVWSLELRRIIVHNCSLVLCRCSAVWLLEMVHLTPDRVVVVGVSWSYAGILTLNWRSFLLAWLSFFVAHWPKAENAIVKLNRLLCHSDGRIRAWVLRSNSPKTLEYPTSPEKRQRGFLREFVSAKPRDWQVGW